MIPSNVFLHKALDLLGTERQSPDDIESNGVHEILRAEELDKLAAVDLRDDDRLEGGEERPEVAGERFDVSQVQTATTECPDSLSPVTALLMEP